MRPFMLDGCENSEHEVFQLLINNTELDVNIWDVLRDASVRFDLSTNALAKHINYKY